MVISHEHKQGVSMRLRFLSGNENKWREAVAIMEPIGITVLPLRIKLEELQTPDTKRSSETRWQRRFIGSDIRCSSSKRDYL